MKSLLLKKVFLSLLILSIISIGLTGCLDIVVPSTTGTVKLVVSGDYEYDLKMDGDTYFSDKPEGTYTLTDVPIGNHSFEAIDTWGSGYGYDSETEYISSGSNYVYLNP